MSLYLKVLLFSFIIPFIASFNSKIKFNNFFSLMFITLLISSVPFILWDIYFTYLGVWGFNSEYHSGILLTNLPLEEILFFHIIPFCCLFTYFVLKKFDKFNLRYNYVVLRLFSLILLVTGLMFYERAYTLSVCLLSALIMLNISFSKSKLNGYFFSTYILISLIPFIIVNGILTGYLDVNTPPVWYNNAEIIGLRFLTIPVEDFLYNFVLMYINYMLFEFYCRRKQKDTTKQDILNN
ncbi:lycopene cyclase domain-containing protein [Flavobacteriales bacterium]|jgi:lycopene cyclase domain-containing protein|nr:lycopene cyclase domain-containing protein [Flavobacteriales bacterium]MDC3394874.1 lycopene cyclase domain-containing protein [Flavobacteriales bacterium]